MKNNICYIGSGKKGCGCKNLIDNTQTIYIYILYYMFLMRG